MALSDGGLILPTSNRLILIVIEYCERNYQIIKLYHEKSKLDFLLFLINTLSFLNK